MSIKVFLGDDHQLLVAGFRQVLGGLGVDVVGVAHSLDGLIEKFLASQAEVLVIDIRFDSHGVNENGLDVCEKLLEMRPHTKIVVFSQFDDQYIIERSYKLGVLAFVRKDESADVLYEAIGTVAQGRQYFSPEIARLLALSVIKENNPSKLLQPNELRAFVLTADGASQSEIAEMMNLSLKTVSTMMNSVKLKLGVEGRADMTKLAIQYGLTTTEPKTRS